MRHKLLALFLFISLASFGQEPRWLDYVYRTSVYPPESYLAGFSSEVDIESANISEAYKQLNQFTRNQIIESIHVSVQAETEMNITIKNTETKQLLDQSSVSFSRAKLAGLKVDNYYDSKRKIAYSFSYVSISDLVSYYRDVLSTNTEVIKKNQANADQYIDSENKDEALKLLFDSKLKLREMDEAVFTLVALGQKDYVDFVEIVGLKRSVDNSINRFFTSGAITLNSVAAFYAYGLGLQVPENSEMSVCVGMCTFKDSGLESEFSQEFMSLLAAKIASETDIQISESEEGCSHRLEGNFWDTPEEIYLVGSIVDKQGEVVGVVDKGFDKDLFNRGDLKFLPSNFDRIGEMKDVSVLPMNELYSIKTIEFLDKPLEVETRLMGEVIPDLPVRLEFLQNDQLQFTKSLMSDKEGNARYFLSGDLITNSGDFLVKAFLDAESFLDLDRSSAFYQQVIRENPLQIAQFKVEVSAPTVFVISSELSLGYPLEVPMLEPSVKSVLADMDYEFVESELDADFVLEIQAATRSGQQSGQWAYFSYLDATISFKDRRSQTEIYKRSFDNVKGGAASFELASVKAYQKAKSSIIDDLEYELLRLKQ